MDKHYLSNYLDCFTNKQFLPIWLLCIILVIIDASSRLNFAAGEQDNNWQIAQSEMSTKAFLLQQDLDKILAGLADYDIETKADSKTANTSQGMSAEEQAKQQGQLEQLYIGNLRYRLVGIFADSKIFAILKQKNINTNEESLVKVAVNDKLQRYKVTKILVNQVLLTSDSNQNITLDLYKKQLASEK